MDPVQEQYEIYPYPIRDPAEEDKRLVTGTPSALVEIDHYLFAGARDWSQPFRVLVAGGGTGDALIMIAQQLADRGCPAEITYIDLSKAARAIAEARAERRGLNTIRFETASLLDASQFGPFDYIDCCGVLHHLPDPAEGFVALRNALAPGGGMGIMLYGELGRTGVYDMQAMLRELTKDGETPQARVEIAKRLIKSLPDSNRLRRNPLITDHLVNDSGLFDLLLHSQDRAYRVPDIYEVLERTGLELISFLAPANYDPDYVVTDAKLKARLSLLSRPEREAFAELLCGNIRKQTFFCAPKDNEQTGRIAQLAEDMIPLLHEVDMENILPMLKSGKPISGRREGLKLNLPVPPLTVDILGLCDGTRTFEHIRQALTPLPGRDGYFDQVRNLYRTFNGLNLMLLRKG